MLEELGISAGTAIILLAVLYFVVKYAVKSGITEAYEEITGKKVKDDLDEILEREKAEREEAKKK